MGSSDTVYLNLPGVAVVSWDATLRAVHIQAQGWANTTEGRAVLEAAIRALTEHQASRFLYDGLNMKVIKQDDQEWIAQDWLPRALAAGLRHTAMVIPKSGLAMMNVDDITASVPDNEIDVRYFTTVGKAREWLAGSPTISARKESSG